MHSTVFSQYLPGETLSYKRTASSVCEMDSAWLKITLCNFVQQHVTSFDIGANDPFQMGARLGVCVCVCDAFFSPKEYVPNPIPQQFLQCKTRLEAAWDSNSGDVLGGDA